jgi:Asp-tRNA(Asn)/Glu-tRNA(Gln) amidotransferase A subunit family amidase
MTDRLPRYALTLTEAAESIAEGRLTALELAEAQLSRIQATDAAIEAWQTLDPAYLRAEAAHCDAGRSDGSLAGIGIGVKDIIATADLPTTMGSPLFATHRPEADAACVARLRAAGGYVFGKTVTTPFAFMDPHKTRNPWDPAHTPGGSSSGSAAAVAAGHVTAALGTQTNGSVVRPAAYCGVVGFKPTLGAIPFAGVHRFSPTFDTVGVFARTVEDAARVAGALADPGRVKPRLEALEAAPRFAYIGDYPWTQLDCDGDDIVEAAVTKLRTRADVVPLDIPAEWRTANVIMRTIMLYEAAIELTGLQQRERASLTPALNAAIDEGRAISQSRYEKALQQRTRAIAFFTEWLAGYDAVLSPAAPGPAPWSLATTGDPSCCTLWSLLGFPAASIPVGFTSSLPIGLQLAAPQRHDDRLLAVAAWCESRLPFRGLV